MKIDYKGCLIILFFLLPSLVGAQDFSLTKVDDLSDTQIQNLVQRGKLQGYTETQAESMAMSMGLSAEEAAKFRDRVAKISSGSLPLEAPNQQIARRTSKISVPRDSAMATNRDGNAVFGMDFFKRADFMAYLSGSENVQAPANYFLGPGDEITVSVYGLALTNRTLKVDSRGFIEFPNLWKMNVSGMTYAQTEEAVIKRLSANFNLQTNQVHTALTFARTISINVTGEIQKPGTFTLPASNSAFNFVAAAGGPTDYGSMRRVKVIRGGKVVQTLDLYAYLTSPGQATLIFLQDGDHIVVEPVGPRSRVFGAVRRPMLYELIPGESVQQLLNYAGGFTEASNTVSVQIRRPVAGQLALLDVPEAAMGSTALNPGDQLEVKKLNESLTEFVQVFGSVRYPGSYSWHQGITASELIALAGGYTDKALRNEAYILREKQNFRRIKLLINPSNAPILLNRDHVYILDNPDLGEGLVVSVAGAVGQSVRVAHAEGLTLGDALRLAGGVKLDADLTKVEISRVNTDAARKKRADLFTMALPEEFAQNSSMTGGALDFELKPYDQVVLRQKPNYSPQKLVYVGGEVMYPGYYALGLYDERINSVMTRAGGPTDFADLDNAKLLRPGAKNVVVELGSAMAKGNSRFNYILSEGDSLVVPTVNNLIQIIGEGHRSAQYSSVDTLNVPYVGRMRANEYIKDYALGFAPRADRSSLYVLYPNGKFSRTRNVLGLKSYPRVQTGGQISVVLKPEKQKVKREVKFDVNQMIGTLTTALTGFATLYLLINR